MSANSRRAEALALADEILADIELSRIAPIEVARKTFRLARVLDDQDAMGWLTFEVNGYRLVQPDNVFEPGGWEAALRSNRDKVDIGGKHTASSTSLGELQAQVEGAKIQLAAAVDRPVSLQSANPVQTVVAPPGNAGERSGIRNLMGSYQALIDKIVGSFHTYVAARFDELRFGSAVETAFEVVRQAVDARIAELVPEGPRMLAAAFENAVSDNPEHWSSAAAVCRRLLKAAADALRPPGDPKQGRNMTESHYVNRLIDWIVERSPSETAADLAAAELEHLGARLDAVDGAGHKGAHASVDRVEASRFLTGTYLLLGDVLRLWAGDGLRAQDGYGAASEPTVMNGETSPVDDAGPPPDE
jgi:AbiTii